MPVKPPTPHSAPAPGLFDHSLQLRWALPALAVLSALPLLAAWVGDTFYVGLASRILIFAIAATSLNLILGFGGLVSFGHAAFVGLGAYTVAVLMQDGTTSAWVAWPAAMAVSAVAAGIIGAISLRTQGVYFIMITLAFAQMLYYLVISLRAYGGEDGLSLAGRSHVGAGLDLGVESTFYYTVLGLLVAVLVGMARLLNARFGHVLQAIRENETRMEAIGFPVLRYKWVAFILAGALAGLAGALLANQGGFVSPALMQWHQSGVLMIMVILGGVGHLYGGVVGAIVYLALEEAMSHYTIHWQLGLGFMLLMVVLLAPNGLTSLIRRKAAA